MLTIDEIKNISFRKATLNGGYRAEDVDSFIDEVIVSFEQLKKEKTNLVHKIDVLATRVEQYRADEETVRNALLASQKVADACIREAKEKAAKIVRDAETKAQTLLVDANNMTAAEKEHYLQMRLISEMNLFHFTVSILSQLMIFLQPPMLRLQKLNLTKSILQRM